ncbi:dTDP-4-dehydrorhamnose reductase [Candidatus Thioglobus sp.]|nr:dTDP-4-dehydrorhamnose reductase [Candidatus Thioglobus sp.]
MRLLLFGANGQVGWMLQKYLAPLGDLKVCSRDNADFNNLDKLQKIVRSFTPDIIINAAAYTSVDKAESEKSQSFQINTTAVEFLAKEAKNLDALLIHYSTDYVFDGYKLSSYNEEDKTNPQTVYGKNKLEGEHLITKSQCKHLIFRTSWLYSIRGKNFLKTILSLAKEKDELRIVSDQIGAPTSAELVANITALCIYKISQNNLTVKEMSGVYHLTSSGSTSWHGFARHFLKEAENLGEIFNVKSEEIIAINSLELILPAKRPLNSILNTEKLCKTFNLTLPSWEALADRIINEIYLRKT